MKQINNKITKIDYEDIQGKLLATLKWDTKRIEGKRQVYYISIEHLPGKQTALKNMQIFNTIDTSLDRFEEDIKIGNGGLGRLASCFLDSATKLGIPFNAQGLYYKNGLFKQSILDNQQVETPDTWQNDFVQLDAETEFIVPFFGQVSFETTYKPNTDETYQRPVYRNTTEITANRYTLDSVNRNLEKNTLSLWKAQRSYPQNQQLVENLNGYLYPDDSTYQGRITRLMQEYLLSYCSTRYALEDAYNRFSQDSELSDTFKPSDWMQIHINDTHPALAIPIFMSILMDEAFYSWTEAWRETLSVFAYTNHTILQEAMERWPLDDIRKVCPRQAQIIEEINRRIINKYGKRYDFIPYGQVNMASLAIHCSHSINGVAELHTKILKEKVLKELFDIYPARFNNKTNGIDIQRWLELSNPELANEIDSLIGSEWRQDNMELLRLKSWADTTVDDVCDVFTEIKQTNKERLMAYLLERYDIEINPDWTIITHAKRFHAYKRQQMTLLYICLKIYRLKNSDGDLDYFKPCTYILSGKSAPAYHFAKTVIKAINQVAEYIDNDKLLSQYLKVVFIPDYSVEVAQVLIPATDISLQVSTAGYEASGTSNFKFAINGAVTVGTMDGANIELAKAIGDKNFFEFGYKAEDVARGYAYDEFGDPEYPELYKNGWEYRVSKQTLKEIIENQDFETIINNIEYGNYFEQQDLASFALTISNPVYLSNKDRFKIAINSIANLGQFSSDRTIKEYARDIWSI